ncbi:MAG: GNAT family protein [Solirubrobacteraceae bacterium]|nr:GNAT family protein [Patulibacter sp.]
MPTAAPQPLPTLVDGAVALRAAVPADAPVLLDLLADPAVAEWWGTNTLASITDELHGHFAIEIGSELAGLLECHQETDDVYPSVAFDIFLGTAFQSRGHGRTSLRLAIDYFVDLGHHRFTIDPAVANEPAIRCYRAVGFQGVGILREAERAPTGEWRNALLMDLLARERSLR